MNNKIIINKNKEEKKKNITAFSSSFHIFTVLSASQVINLEPLLSNVEAKIPISLSKDPGCTIVSPS